MDGSKLVIVAPQDNERLLCLVDICILTIFQSEVNTTSTALASVFYLWLNLACYMKLADEVRNAFKSNAEIRSSPQLAGCRYLRPVSTRRYECLRPCQAHYGDN